LTDTWLQLTSGATIRYFHSAVAVGTDMFIFAGYNGASLNDLWKYDTLTDTWSQLTSGAITRYSHSAVVVGTDMFIFAGYDSSTLTYLNDVQKYNVQQEYLVVVKKL